MNLFIASAPVDAASNVSGLADIVLPYSVAAVGVAAVLLLIHGGLRWLKYFFCGIRSRGVGPLG